MKYARSKPESQIMEITPAVAQEMLATSAGNRRMRQWYIDLLAATMARGEWRLTNNGIGFDYLGRLRDRHHTLSAVVKSGVTITQVVVMGMQTNAYEVIDVGMLRTYADRLLEDRTVAEVLRLGCAFALNNQKPTIDQMRPIVDAGLGDAARSLIAHCGTKRRYFASAPIKLAACVAIMNGASADYVMAQYRALCSLDFEAMSKSAQALVRQVDSGKTQANNTREVLARGFRVFDKDRQGVTRIQVTEADADAAVELVRAVLRRSISEENQAAAPHGGKRKAPAREARV